MMKTLISESQIRPQDPVLGQEKWDCSPKSQAASVQYYKRAKMQDGSDAETRMQISAVGLGARQRAFGPGVWNQACVSPSLITLTSW